MHVHASAMKLTHKHPYTVNTISSVEFSQNGEFLATGDVSGRVSVYKAANAGPAGGARVLLPGHIVSHLTNRFSLTHSLSQNGTKARAGTAEARSVAKSGTPIYRKAVDHPTTIKASY